MVLERHRYFCFRLILTVLILCSASPVISVADHSLAVDCTVEYPPDLTLFSDAISHWQKKHGRDRNDPRLEKTQYVEIANRFLELQNEDGGWSKDIDWLALIPRADLERLHGGMLGKSTCDNRNTYPQVEYLAKVYCLTLGEEYRNASERGLDYILGEQNESGGWCGRDVDAITFNDEIMSGIMGLLLGIETGVGHFQWLDEKRNLQAKIALDRAIEVTLKCQIEVQGKKTAWCQQHDHGTLEPVAARAYELPSITANESVSVVEFLQRIPDPTPKVLTAIDSALNWFRQSALKGLRLRRVPIQPVRFKNHTATYDVMVVKDPVAPPLWARFYDVETGQPIFCKRDGTQVTALSEVELERRSGYAWYGYWPAPLLDSKF